MSQSELDAARRTTIACDNAAIDARTAENVVTDRYIAELKAQIVAPAPPVTPPAPTPPPVPVPPVVPPPSGWTTLSVLNATTYAGPSPLPAHLPVPDTSWLTDSGHIDVIAGRFAVTLPKGLSGGTGNGNLENNSPSTASRRIVFDGFGVSPNFQQHPVQTKIFFLCQNTVFVSLRGPAFVPFLEMQSELPIVVPGAARWDPLPNQVNIPLGTGHLTHQLVLEVTRVGSTYTLELFVNGTSVSRWANVTMPFGPGGSMKFHTIWGGSGGQLTAAQQVSVRSITIQGHA